MVLTKFAPLAAVVALATLSSTVSAALRVDPGVHRALRRQGTVNLIVTLKQDTSSALNSVQEASFDSRGAKIQALVDKLQTHAASSQGEVVKMILQESSEATPLFSKVDSLWISNELYFENASFELVEKLAGLASVGAIREEGKAAITADASIQANATAATSIQWGVSLVKAPEVWATGNTGQGVVVGVVDSGVRGTHETLRGNVRNGNNWLDPTANQATSYDDSGHGTHVASTAVGANGYGVAPGATWIGCRGCTKDLCDESALKKCMQFMLCPTDVNGKNPDCSKAPNVVNNSWGGPGGDTTYEAGVKAWLAAGIIPVFSLGNTGASGCKTAGSPGDSPNVIGVGATSSADGLGGFSAKGPSVAGLIKPDITAPGVGVLAANYKSDTDYRSIDGTSHAAPHVTGVIALMLSANKNLNFNQVRSILTTTTDQTPILKPSGYTCGGTADAKYPNNQYGYGRVNALNAVLKAKSSAQ